MKARLALACALLIGCTPRFARLHPEVQTPVEIHRVELRWSNAYLLRSGAHDLLVDAGSPGDEERITRALEGLGRKPSDLEMVVLTHGHADHAGMGRFFQKAGVKIVVGRGDEVLTKQGHDDDLHSTGLTAWMIKPLINFPYEPFTPDLIVDDTLSLEKQGFPDVTVRRMPGHTAGSLVVLAGRFDALVGDEVLGGFFGGAMNAHEPGEHYYQHDIGRNRCNIEWLLEAGVTRFYLGHGGPVARDDVLTWRKQWESAPRPCGGLAR